MSAQQQPSNRCLRFWRCLGWIWLTLMVALLGAHFYRAAEYGIVLCAGGMLVFLCSRSLWKQYAVAYFLFWGMLEWGHSGWVLAAMRQQMGMPWMRAAFILLTVGLLTGFAGVYARRRAYALADRVGEGQEKDFATAAFQGAVFISVFVLLFALRQTGAVSFLLLERYFPLLGSVQIFFVAWYGAVVAGKLIDPVQSRKVRKWLWLVFGCVFFAQFTLGSMGIEKMLLTGELHVPIPAFIIYGPIFRDTGSVMPFIVFVSVILAGSAWCSLLCYFGPFDALASRQTPIRLLPPFLRWALVYGRPLVLASGILIAFLLRSAGFETATVIGLAVLYGLASVLAMAWASRTYGGMLHCVTACPLGLLVNVLGRLSPWRLRVAPERCNDCGACEQICSYRALTPESRKAGKSLLRCALCRDCVSVCHGGAISISGAGFSPKTAWKVFTGIITVLHTIFLSLAMV